MRPPPLSSESFSLCHPLCKQTQFSRKLSSSCNANIPAVFSPDIHSRGSMAKVGLQKCAKDEGGDSCLLGTYFTNGKSSCSTHIISVVSHHPMGSSLLQPLFYSFGPTRFKESRSKVTWLLRGRGAFKLSSVLCQS